MPRDVVLHGALLEGTGTQMDKPYPRFKRERGGGRCFAKGTFCRRVRGASTERGSLRRDRWSSARESMDPISAARADDLVLA